MTTLSPLNPATSALLLMDFQNDILANNLPPEQAASVMENATTLLQLARSKAMPVIHVVVCFRPGHPEISEANRVFRQIKHNGLFVQGAPGTAIHPQLQPLASEAVVRKHRVGAFSGTDLQTLLRANQVDTLLIAGVATSGVVLSTVRHAADQDYRLIVVADGCADPDEEVHRVLLEKVIARQAEVVSTAQVLAAVA